VAILAPTDEAECRLMLQTAYEHPGPALVRYPRGAGIGAEVGTGFETLPWGRADLVRRGRDVALLVFGTLLDSARQVAERLGASLVNMRFVKPLDVEMVLRMAAEHRLLVTLEENMVQGGAGSAVNEALQDSGVAAHVLNLGFPDRFVEQATQAEQLEMMGLSVDQIEARVRDALDGLGKDSQAARA
jgi:1-deoxy-D-xylulose-5-phosphate synthase